MTIHFAGFLRVLCGCVTTGWHVLRLCIGIHPPDMKGSCECIE